MAGPFWGQRFNLVVAIVIALAWLAWHASMGISAWHWPWLALATSVAIAYALAVVIVVEWIILRVIGRGAPAVPWLPRRWWGSRVVLAVMVVFVVAVTALREGVLGPRAIFSVDAYRTYAEATSTRTPGAFVTGETTLGLANRPIACQLTCAPSSVACTLVLAAVKCQEPTVDTVMITGHVEIDVETSLCYLPFYKSADVQWKSELEITAGPVRPRHKFNNRPVHEIQQWLAVEGAVHLTMRGVASCHTFRRVVGRGVADQFLDAVNDHLSAR